MACRTSSRPLTWLTKMARTTASPGRSSAPASRVVSSTKSGWSAPARTQPTSTPGPTGTATAPGAISRHIRRQPWRTSGLSRTSCSIYPDPACTPSLRQPSSRSVRTGDHSRHVSRSASSRQPSRTAQAAAGSSARPKITPYLSAWIRIAA